MMRSGRCLMSRVMGLSERRTMTQVPKATDEATSRKMRAVRQTSTSPEMTVRATLDALGFRFRVNVEGQPGRPDIWLTRDDIPIFVHGCFWHRHEGCKKATTPQSNREFWIAKFEQNKERDERKVRDLQRLGYTSITIWQCETDCESTLRQLLLYRIEAARLAG